MALPPVGRAAARWLPVVAAVLVAVGSFVAASATSERRSPDVEAAGGSEVQPTPVLSARRVPDLTAAPIAERRLTAALDDLVAGLDASVCLEVRDGDRVLYEHRPLDPVVPASTQKLLTAVAALSLLGPDHTYETVVAGPALDGSGVLAGDLHLIGGGDPLLATDPYLATFRRQPQIHTDFEALADALVAAGLREVRGSVVGDETRYDTARSLPVPQVWMPEDITADVAGPLSALFVDDGFVAYPGDGEGTTTFVEAPDPAAHAAGRLTELLVERGVVVDAPARSGPAPVGLSTLARLESPPLRTVVEQMLTESDNSTAELVLKELGVAAGRAGTSEAGIDVLETTLAESGLTLEGTVVLDGSGVANGNRATCRLLGELLTDDGTDDAVTDGLAVAGETGTLAGRYVETPLAGNLRAKTGSLRIVTALAGEVDPLQGGALQFAYVANVEPGEVVSGPLVAAQEQLGFVLLAHPSVPDPAALGPLPDPG